MQYSILDNVVEKAVSVLLQRITHTSASTFNTGSKIFEAYIFLLSCEHILIIGFSMMLCVHRAIIVMIQVKSQASQANHAISMPLCVHKAIVVIIQAKGQAIQANHATRIMACEDHTEAVSACHCP